MKFKKPTVGLGIVFVLTISAASNAVALFVEGQFTGTITNLVDNVNALPSTITVGDSVTGRFNWDLNASDLTDGSAASDIGVYQFTNKPSGLEYFIEGRRFAHSFAAPPNPANGLGYGITVYNNTNIPSIGLVNVDALFMQGLGTSTSFDIFLSGPSPLAVLDLNLIDLDQLILSDDSIPTSIDLNEVDSTLGRILLYDDSVPGAPAPVAIGFVISSLTMNVTSARN